MQDINTKIAVAKNRENFKNIRNIDHINIYDKKEFTKEEIEYFYLFWNSVDIRDYTECWNWIRYIGYNGYGRFRFYNEMWFVHRIAYTLTKGSIPEGLQVQHTCNNRACCNPRHLELGDNSKNQRYRTECNRQNCGGGNNSQAKITEEDAREIHKLFSEQRALHPGYKQWQVSEPIGKKFGISSREVNNIVQGKRWPHIYEDIIIKSYIMSKHINK